MNWTASEIADLVQALAETANAFYARRVLRRLEGREISIARAAWLLRYPIIVGPYLDPARPAEPRKPHGPTLRTSGTERVHG